MAVNEIVRRLDLSEEEIEAQLLQAMQSGEMNSLDRTVEDSVNVFEPDTILEGTVLRVTGTDVIVDIGYKSEGIIPLDHFDHPSEVERGDKVEVLLEQVEDETGTVVLSKKKADRIRGWERIITNKKEGDTVTGRVLRKIKGGLLVDIGIPVFLPASQVALRRVPDIGDYVGQDIDAQIIKIDEGRMNIVISRRKLLEGRREKQKLALLSTLKEGDVVEGVVKNIADFGAFVDLGSIDGLLHITDMSWGRVSHPSEVVAIDEKVKVKVLRIDLDRERISLGLKQLSPSPWESVEGKYPVESRQRGTVVNILSYGAFVKLEEGIEGLVHISEMSWTRRINHPSEMVAIGDTVDVVVLDINKDKQEISLGMKQVEPDPWDLVEEKYPPGTVINGRVRNLTNYGAFVEIEEGIDGLLHVSDMSWTRKVLHPSEVVKKGEKVQAVVLSVDREKKRVALSMKHLETDPWQDDIPGRYRPGSLVEGTVTKITNFGVFVELENGLEGLLHVSELTHAKIENPADLIQPNDELDLKVIKIDTDERKIGLSLKQALDDMGEDEQDLARRLKAQRALRAKEEADKAPPPAEASADEAEVETAGEDAAEEAAVTTDDASDDASDDAKE